MRRVEKCWRGLHSDSERLMMMICTQLIYHILFTSGAQEVVTVDWCDGDGVNGGQDANLAIAEALVQDLSTRERWDAAFICRAPKVLHMSMLKSILAPTAIISDLRPRSLYTDKIGGFLSLFYGLYLNVRRTFTVNNQYWIDLIMKLTLCI